MFVLRVPKDAKEDVGMIPSSNSTQSSSLWQATFSQGRRSGMELEQMVNFYVGQVVTGLSRMKLTAGGQECIVYSTISGSIGVLYPFSAKEEVDFFTHFEMYMRQETQNIIGRDHLSFRSYYSPVKNVIDGDLCEQFASLPLLTQMKIAENLSRTPGEVVKRLDDLRNRIL